MVISESVLYSAGADIKKYRATEFIFKEGEGSHYYYQIMTGNIKLNNYDSDGKEFIQNILADGESFGESVLFIDQAYPMNAEAMTECSILRLCKSAFFELMAKFPKLYLEMCKSLSQRLYYKFVMMQNISFQNSAARLTGLMEYLKGSHNDRKPYSFMVPLTRQQMASLTGLCVETTIRTIKTMEKQQIVRIKDRKIYY
ncbi:Crp/Fnr family transcriptional regulator [Chryseobacterium oranimense]|jgi:CRP-like cAMP-binding protein|uniref:Crp/Fnr family transcriptional regulator n=1 Tax=Chryseobacterium oranimense TaxID=421058 RepID=UPI000533927D|nr:Crp/Fnr family transcriptional regulator [Chryseobacterium oranimense]CEJ70154.1 cAMP-activated global transcriptional regulator CRP [Chryseobacterium oranimense G311]